MKDKELKSKIISAFIESKFRWRTVNGISKEIEIPYEDVFKFLENSDLFINAKKSNKKGQRLFSLRKKYNENSSFGVKLLNAITNKIH
ncbi:MAG: hypothetical protein COC06_11990 [Bacteroidales bacterium]|nr:MAG: hypothetical protein COC06_11990 [Bacteroidales bacterium]